MGIYHVVLFEFKQSTKPETVLEVQLLHCQQSVAHQSNNQLDSSAVKCLR